MRRKSMPWLAALLVASCASRGQPSDGPTATAPLASPTSTVLSPTASPTVAPPATMPPDLGLRALAITEGVRLTIEAASAPLVVGEATNVRLRIENLGSTSVHWVDSGCGLPGGWYVQLRSDGWVGGASHTGIAAEFKAFALEVAGHSGYSPLSIDLQPDAVTERLGCVAAGIGTNGGAVAGRLTAGGIGVGRELAPDSSMQGTVRWTGGSQAPVPAGPADVVYGLRFSSTAELEDSFEVEARLASWIVSDDVVDFLPPGPAIDIALADEEFATWLAEAPSSTWINSHHALDLAAGTWTIGLFREGPDGLYGGVTFDARTGEVTDHRFE